MPRFFLAVARLRLMPASAFFAALLLLQGCTPKGQNTAPETPPYFASLKHSKSWGRRGPSRAQPVLWEYHWRGLPMLVVDAIPQWRQVRGPDGEVVWMSATLLSRRPMAMIRDAKPVPLYRTAGGDQSIIAYADPGALLRLGQCLKSRCALSHDNIRGWADKAALWGVDARATAKDDKAAP